MIEQDKNNERAIPEVKKKDTNEGKVDKAPIKAADNKTVGKVRKVNGLTVIYR